MVTQTNKAIAAAVGTTAALAVGLWASRRSQKRAEDKAEAAKATDGVVDMPNVPLARVEEFFARVNAQMMQTVMELEMKLSPYRDQVPPAQLHMIMQQQFEESLERFQDSLLDEWDVTEEEIEHATEYFAEEPAVRSGVQKLKRMHASVCGQPMTDILPKDLTEDKMCQALPLFFDASIRAMADVATEFNVDPGNPVEMEQMSQLFMSRQEAYVADALAPFGLSVDLIGVALKKFETSQQLGEIWAAGQARQQMELRKLGF